MRAMNTMKCSVVGLVLGAAAATQSLAMDSYFVTVNMLPYANQSLGRSTFATGSLVLAGVPFRIENQGNNIWSAAVPGGSGTRTLEVIVNLEGVKKVHTLINTDWGQAGPVSYATIQFVGADGTVVSEELVGNVNIRDWNQFVWTNSLTATNAVVAQAVGSTRLDKQVWTMPLDIVGQELRAIRIIDNGNQDFQRVFVSGIALEIDQPAPARWSASQGGNNNRYQWVQRPQGISWEDASTEALSRGGWLATITSAAENAFVYSRLGGNQAFWRNGIANAIWGPWIGGFQLPGSGEPAMGWSWVQPGEAFGYTNWAPGEPNNVFANQLNEDRVHFFSAGPIPAASTWNDLPGTELLNGYVLELPPCDSIDFNRDGLFPDDADLLDFLSVLAGGECSTGDCNSIDFNGDTLFPDDTDLIAFLTVLAGGDC
jgi:hypothetical protein